MQGGGSVVALLLEEQVADGEGDQAGAETDSSRPARR